MRIKTSELTGRALNWAVAKAEGLYFSYDRGLVLISTDEKDWSSTAQELNMYNPSSDWSQGGPIIEREGFDVGPLLDVNDCVIEWTCYNYKGDGLDVLGHTPLIAAMRCYVANKLGDILEVPDALF